MATYNNQLLVLTAAGAPTKIAAASTIKVAGGFDETPIGLVTPSTGAFSTLSSSGLSTLSSLSVTGSASVGGDLTVTGDIISRGTVNLVVSDSFIDLNFGNTTTTTESGGLTISMNRTATFTTAGTTSAFVVGNAGVSNPTFTSTGGSLLAAADIIMIEGASTASNDGLYEVSAVDQAASPQVVTIKGIGTSATNASLPFVQNQFAADAASAGSVMKIDLAVWAAADGTTAFKQASGAAYAKGTFVTAYATAAVLSDFNGNGDYKTAASTLQSAYDGGNSVLTAGTAPITFNLAADAAGLSVQGSLAGDGIVSIGGTTTVDSFVVGTAAAVAITAGSTATLTAALGSAASLADGAGSLVMTSGSLTETSLVNTTLTGSGTMTLTGGGVSTFGDDTGTLIFGGTGAVTTNGMTTVDIDGSGIVSVNSSAAAINIGDDAIAQPLNLGTGAAARVISVGSASSTSVTLTAAEAADAIVLKLGANAYVSLNGSDSSVDMSKSLIFPVGGSAAAPTQAIGFFGTSGEAIVQGNVVSYNSAGALLKADSNSGAIGDAIRYPVGAAQTGVADATPFPYGAAGIVTVLMDGAATGNIGKPVYLSATAGVATQTAPTVGTVYKLGILRSVSDAGSLALLNWAPQFVADLT
jgi:fibronectin-binding autotransporter adhesin